MATINSENLRREIRSGKAAGLEYADFVDGWKKLVIEEFLADNNGHESVTAKQLGMHRNSLIATMKKLNIDVKQFRIPGRKQTRVPKLGLPKDGDYSLNFSGC